MIFGEVDSFFSLLERAKRGYAAWRGRTAENVAERFIRLFENHGVHRNQIPRFLEGYDLALSDVQDNAALLAKLDESLLEAACECFSVRREWLDGASGQAHFGHDFYKSPADFQSFLETLLTNSSASHMRGVLVAPERSRHNAAALLILEEEIGAVGDDSIHRYHLCNNWSYSYWKARAYLTACIAIAWKHEIYVQGTSLSNKEIDRLANGEILLGRQGRSLEGLGTGLWHPEDLAAKPEVFLEGVDQEHEGFGHRAALELWLALDSEGWMNTGIKELEGSRESFSAALRNM